MVVGHVRLRIGGSLPGGEVWSVNPSFIGNFDPTSPTHTELQTWATAAADYLATEPLGSYGTMLSNRATIDTVRAEWYDTTGRLADYAEAALDPAYSGTESLTQSPTVAVCISLYSAVPGRQNRGRLYWPALGLELDTATGRIPAATVTLLANQGVTLLGALEAAAPAGWDAVLAVYSKVRGAGIAITSLRVGDVPDSQRGRKSALVEAYASAPYTP